MALMDRPRLPHDAVHTYRRPTSTRLATVPMRVSRRVESMDQFGQLVVVKADASRTTDTTVFQRCVLDASRAFDEPAMVANLAMYWFSP